MRTTYYLVTAAALVVAALTVYAQFPDLNRPVPPPATAAAPTDVPRLVLPPVALPPDEPLVMPAVTASKESPALPPVPAVDPVKPPLPTATPAGHTEPVPPVVPAVPSSTVPPTPSDSIPPVPPAVLPVPSSADPAAVPPPPVTPAVPPPASTELPAVSPPSVPVPPAPSATPPAPLTAAEVPVVPLPKPDVPAAAPVPPAPVTPPALPVAKPDAPAVQPPAIPSAPANPPAPTLKPPAQPSLVPPPAPFPAPTPVLQPPVPAPAAGTQPPAQPEALPGTKYVVLKDDKVIEGAVTLRGDAVVVREGALDRSFTKGQVQFVGDSRDDVYKFMLAKVPATDMAARLKVARWCMFSGLREQALTEAREVQKLQPANADAAGLVRSLELSLQQFPPGGAAKMATPAAPTFPADLSGRPSAPAAVEPEPDVTPEAANLFATKVQVFLANQCVDCHAKPDAGRFVLTRVDPANAGHHATKANLRAVAGQLRKDEPAASPLLVKTLIAHGGQKVPAVPSRQAAAYQTLEAWAALAVGAPTMGAPAAPPAALPAAPTAAVPASPTTPALPPVAAPAAEPLPVLPPVANPTAPAVPTAPALPAAEPVLPPVVPAVPPAVPMIPAADPLVPPVPAVPPVAPAAPPLPKPTAPPIPPASASGFGTTSPPKPPVTGPAGDEFDPAGFNKPK